MQLSTHGQWLLAVSERNSNRGDNLLVVFSNATVAPFAMFASKRPADHTSDTKIVLIELVRFQKLIYNSALLVPTPRFGDISRIFGHGHEVEIGTK